MVMIVGAVHDFFDTPAAKTDRGPGQKMKAKDIYRKDILD